jgi:hypothetical protein
VIDDTQMYKGIPEQAGGVSDNIQGVYAKTIFFTDIYHFLSVKLLIALIPLNQKLKNAGEKEK